MSGRHRRHTPPWALLSGLCCGAGVAVVIAYLHSR